MGSFEPTYGSSNFSKRNDGICEALQEIYRSSRALIDERKNLNRSMVYLPNGQNQEDNHGVPYQSRVNQSMPNKTAARNHFNHHIPTTFPNIKILQKKSKIPVPPNVDSDICLLDNSNGSPNNDTLPSSNS